MTNNGICNAKFVIIAFSLSINPEIVQPKTPAPCKNIFNGQIFKLVNKIPVKTKKVLIHLRYFFINIILLPNFYQVIVMILLNCNFFCDYFTCFCTFCTNQKILNYICYISFQNCLQNCLDI